MVVARDWAVMGEGEWKLLINGDRLSVLQDERVTGTSGGDSWTTT